MENGVIPASYKHFLENFAADIDSARLKDYEPPFELVTFYIVPSEVEAECQEWIRRYLSLNKCPIELLSHLIRSTYRNFEDSRNLSTFYIEADVKHDDDDDDDGANEGYRGRSECSSDDEHIHDHRPPQIDSARLLQAVVSCVHTTVKAWNTAPPQLSLSPTSLHVCSHAIKNKRRKMEDRHVIIPDMNVLFDLKDSAPLSFFAVYDGHGGLEAAEYAATHLHGHLVNDQKFKTDPEAAMKQAYKTTDMKFIEKAKREGLRSGTTGITVLVLKSEIYIGWLGDSQAILVRSGQPMQVMIPHKPEREDEKKRIEELGGSILFLGVWRVNGNISVSRSIGDLHHKPFISSDADVTRIPLTGEEEYIVLACDGLWDVLSPNQVTNIVYRHFCSSPGAVDDVAVILVNAARDLGSSDNISVIVVRFRSFIKAPHIIDDYAIPSLLCLEKNLEMLSLSSSNLNSMSSSPSSSSKPSETSKEKNAKAKDGDKKKGAKKQKGSVPARGCCLTCHVIS